MITVIICTHNPKIDNIKRAILALKKQTLSLSKWELIIVDNNSDVPVTSYLDIKWHPSSKIIIEKKLGKVNASLCAIQNAIGNLLVFVDDDNLLNKDYLEKASTIAMENPFVGAFGGSQIGEFEEYPNKHSLPYMELIAIRNVPKTIIANCYEWRNTPPGAGLVIRSNIAKHYLEQVTSDFNRVKLDRIGKSLMCSGDIDLAYTSIDLGFLNGLFPELSLIHVISKERVQLKYLSQLQKYNVVSNGILEFIRFKKKPEGKDYISYLKTQFVNLFKFDFFEFTMEKSRREGFLLSIKMCNEMHSKQFSLAK